MQSFKRVLVVDDEATALAVTGRMLRDAGFAVSMASSAREALRMLELADEPVDLVLTDVVMPETDGHALGRLIAERRPMLPIIYMSAYPERDVFHRGAPGPGAPFLAKPFAPEILIAAVQRLLEDPAAMSSRPR